MPDDAAERAVAGMLATRKPLTQGRRDRDRLWSIRRRLFSLLPAREPTRAGRPLFLVGTVRSGSTLLANCLDLHPDIHYLGFELNGFWRDVAGIAVSGNGRPHCVPLSEKDVSPARRERVRRGFADVLRAEGVPEGGRWLNKNPHLSNKLPFLRALFPDAALLVSGRDIRSTVASVKLLWMYGHRKLGMRYFLPEESTRCWSIAPPAARQGMDLSRVFPGGSAAVLAEYWLRTYEIIERTAQGFEPVLAVRHRDVVASPHATLSAVHRSLGLPPSPQHAAGSLDSRRDRRWSELLTGREKRELETFIETHRDRILRLRYADTRL